MATATIDNGDEGKDFGVRRLMVWTAAREEKLLELWKSRRCLFDPNTSVTKAERQLALAEVAGELGIAGLSRTHVPAWRGPRGATPTGAVTAASRVMCDHRIHVHCRLQRDAEAKFVRMLS